MTHDDDTISAREILALNGATPLIWEGKRIQYTSPEYAPGYHRTFEWVDYPAEPGTSVPMGTLGMREAGEFDTPTHVEIPVTLWGDYCGDDCGRSNFRSLTRDYPDTFVEVYDASGSHYLALPLDAEIYRGLFDEIKDVAENYPLYDESDHSEMEMEAVESAWDEFLSFDVPRALREAGVSDDTIDAGMDDGSLREMFYEITGEMPDYPYFESATSIVFPYFEDTITEMVSRLTGGENG